MSELTDELMDALGEEGFLKLIEVHGGIRLYIPKNAPASKLSSEIGSENTARLSNMFSGEYISVPLAREFRANHYRAQGESNAMIARRLGLTESGVERIFSRVPKPIGGRKKDPRQIEMF
ncbi:hypothetical protein [Rhizobium sp. 18055]|uniref:hypothetical protein n=1 Tax=Rhizobium sp. 18055 TaxID=2681403 RepID=UPI001358AE68|nr:hypothetical protein [Rhizobium sp. 18055]